MVWLDNLLSGGHGQLQVPFSNTLSTPMMVFMNMMESLDNDYGYNQNEHKLAITTNTVSFLWSNRVEEWQSCRDSREGAADRISHSSRPMLLFPIILLPCS